MEYMRALNSLRSRMSSMSQGTDEVKPTYVQARQPQGLEDKSTEDIIAQSQAWLQDIRSIAEQARKLNLQSKPSGEAGFAKGFRQSYGNRPKQRPAPLDSKAEDEKVAPLVARRGERPSNYAPDGNETTPIPTDAPVTKVLDAIAAVESRGSGDYEAVGPVVKKGMYKGQRAYGRYQVMDGNIGPWSEEALGKRITKEEFIANPEYQDAIAAHRLQLAKDQHGTWEDAASVWFSGQPVSMSANANDDYLSTPQYIYKFRRNFVRA